MSVFSRQVLFKVLSKLSIVFSSPFSIHILGYYFSLSPSPLHTQYTYTSYNLAPSRRFHILSLLTLSLLKLLRKSISLLSLLCYRPSLSFSPLPYSQAHTQNSLFALLEFYLFSPFIFLVSLVGYQGSLLIVTLQCVSFSPLSLVQTSLKKLRKLRTNS